MIPDGPGRADTAPADPAPPIAAGSLVEHEVARWARVDEGPVEVFVAFTGRGASFVRPVESVAGDPSVFVDAYRRRFGRPLQPAADPPAEVVGALVTGEATGLVLDLSDLTPFEQRVLRAAAGIPRGEARPYHWVAAETGRPAAARAAGSALGRNPVPLLIPCHRVTRADGSPGPYAFGAPLKEALLRSEGVNLDEVVEMARRRVFYLASSATRSFCYPTCPRAREVPEPDRQGFRTAAEASACGHRPCRHCRPRAPVGRG